MLDHPEPAAAAADGGHDHGVLLAEDHGGQYGGGHQGEREHVGGGGQRLGEGLLGGRPALGHPGGDGAGANEYILNHTKIATRMNETLQ